MAAVTVAFLHLPRHTPPGAHVGGLGTTPCYEFPESPPAIRWDAELQFSADVSTMSLYRGRKLVVYQRVLNVTRWFDKSGAACATSVFAAAEVFGLNGRGRSAPDTHSVGTPWKLECVAPKTHQRNASVEKPAILACRMRSRVVGKVELRVWNGDPLPDTAGFPDCGYGVIEQSDDTFPGDRSDDGAVGESYAPGVFTRATEFMDRKLKGEERRSTAIPGSASEYRYRAGVDHCADAPRSGIVPERPRIPLPLDFENESDIPIVVPPWVLEDLDGRLVDASPLRPSPGGWLAAAHVGPLRSS